MRSLFKVSPRRAKRALGGVRRSREGGMAVPGLVSRVSHPRRFASTPPVRRLRRLGRGKDSRLATRDVSFPLRPCGPPPLIGFASPPPALRATSPKVAALLGEDLVAALLGEDPGAFGLKVSPLRAKRALGCSYIVKWGGWCWVRRW